MFRNRSYVFFALAIGLALVTTVMTYNWLQDQTPIPVVQQIIEKNETQIAVATQDLPWGTPLTKENVRLVEYPTGHMPAGKFLDTDSLIGRIIITPVKQHELILESKLAPQDVKNGGVIGVLTPGKRAMAVRVNEVVGLPGFVKPGDRVDIMVTMKNNWGKGKTTKTVLENTLVLATGKQMERRGPGEKPKSVKVITFELTLKDAEKLALATSLGKLRLALRSPLNTKPEYTVGATPNSLLASFRAKRAKGKVGKRKPKEKVELIIGGKRKIFTF